MRRRGDGHEAENQRHGGACDLGGKPVGGGAQGARAPSDPDVHVRRIRAGGAHRPEPAPGGPADRDEARRHRALCRGPDRGVLR